MSTQIVVRNDERLMEAARACVADSEKSIEFSMIRSKALLEESNRIDREQCEAHEAWKQLPWYQRLTTPEPTGWLYSSHSYHIPFFSPEYYTQLCRAKNILRAIELHQGETISLSVDDANLLFPNNDQR